MYVRSYAPAVRRPTLFVRSFAWLVIVFETMIMVRSLRIILVLFLPLLSQAFSTKRSRFQKEALETFKQSVSYPADVFEVKSDTGSVPPWAIEEAQGARKLETSTVQPPPDCLTDESQIVYVNGIISATETFKYCLSQIAEPMSLPSIYNGSVHGLVSIYNSIQLNNLHEVTLSPFVSHFLFCLIVCFSTGRRRSGNCDA
jgi:hypothetical protein